MILNSKSEILKCINQKLKEIVPPPPNPLFGHIISRSSNKQTHFDRVSAFVCKTHIWQTFRSNNIFLHFSPCCSCSTRQPVAASHISSRSIPVPLTFLFTEIRPNFPDRHFRFGLPLAIISFRGARVSLLYSLQSIVKLNRTDALQCDCVF